MINNYNPDAICPKCGFTRITSEFSTEEERMTERGIIIPYHEYIRRYCDRCKYSWNEMCLDYEKQQEELKRLRE